MSDIKRLQQNYDELLAQMWSAVDKLELMSRAMDKAGLTEWSAAAFKIAQELKDDS